MTVDELNLMSTGETCWRGAKNIGLELEEGDLVSNLNGVDKLYVLIVELNDYSI